jgi:hypothetical protein
LSPPSVRRSVRKRKEKEVDSLSVVRLEDDGDGTPIRVTTRAGRRPVSRLPVSVVKNGLDAVLSSNPDLPASLFTTKKTKPVTVGCGPRLGRFDDRHPARNSERRDRLVKRYGRSTGKQQGFDRYESVQGPHRIEVLTDPQTSVVVAVNTLRDGVALDRTTLITHKHRRCSGSQGIRSESRIDSERRAVTEIEFSKVKFEQREGR